MGHSGAIGNPERIMNDGFLMEFIPTKARTGMTKKEEIFQNPSSPPFAKGRDNMSNSFDN